ncbi:MAG: DUF3108 domain-containing protein [Gemmatimonadaceae bacterium]
MPTADNVRQIPSRPRGREGIAIARGMRALLASTVSLLVGATSAARAQEPNALPFAIGERMTYSVKIGPLGAGRGAMWIEGPVEVRGISTYLLRSKMRARVGFVTASDDAESWLDPLRMTALRYHKRQRRAMSGEDEAVELFPTESRWEGKHGTRGDSPTDDPLDELSFIYYVRTLPLTSDSVSRFVRHYDRERNPVEVRVVGRDTIVTDAGTFPTIIVEMRVKDSRRYQGTGTIRLHLSDDVRRIPVRIESRVPVIGHAVLTLVRYDAPAAPRLLTPD